MIREREIKVTEKEYRIAFVFLVHYIFQHEYKVNEVLEKGNVYLISFTVQVVEPYVDGVRSSYRNHNKS